MPSKKNFLLLSFAACLLFCCRRQPAAEQDGTSVVPQTPVTVTHISNGTITDYIELNATSSYLQHSYIKAGTNGYIKSVGSQLGEQVKSGQNLFTLVTKEAWSIGNSINKLNADFRFSGVTYIRTESAGFVSQINHQTGDYVQEGELLAVITSAKSFVFLMDLPFEWRPLVKINQRVQIQLADGENYAGIVRSFMPAVDSLSQTQRVIIRLNPSRPIPENVIGKVRLAKESVSGAGILPRSAVLTNETQDEFWVMRLINDSVAVKTPVKKGIELNGKVQILSPRFSSNDQIITTGNYGLADTARVKIVGKQ